jgi:hypothetical protein
MLNSKILTTLTIDVLLDLRHIIGYSELYYRENIVDSLIVNVHGLLGGH